MEKLEKESFYEVAYSLHNYRLDILDLSNRYLKRHENISPFNTEEEVMKILERDNLYKIISSLEEVDRKIILYRWGLADGICHTLEETGKLVGLSKETVRAHENNALMRLGAFKDLFFDDGELDIDLFKLTEQNKKR